MNIWISIGMLFASTVGAYAGSDLRLVFLKLTRLPGWLRWVSSGQSRRLSGSEGGANKWDLGELRVSKGRACSERSPR